MNCASCQGSMSLFGVTSGRASARPGPGFAREGEIGVEVEDAAGSLARRDGEADADRLGTLLHGFLALVDAAGRGVGVERAGPAIGRDVRVDGGDARDRVVPGVALQAAVGSNSRPATRLRSAARQNACASGGSGSHAMRSASAPTGWRFGGSRQSSTSARPGRQGRSSAGGAAMSMSASCARFRSAKEGRGSGSAAMAR